MAVIWPLLFDRAIVVTMAEFCLIELGVSGQLRLFEQQRIVCRRDCPCKEEPAGADDGQCGNDHRSNPTRR